MPNPPEDYKDAATEQIHQVAPREIFVEEDTRQSNGSMQLVLDKPWYEPGDTIKGKIYIRATRNINGVEGIELKVKGGFKNAFTRHWQAWEVD